MNKENDKKWMIFDVFIDTQSQYKNVGISRTEFWKINVRFDMI